MSEPQPIPINAYFQGDFVNWLVVVTTADTMAEVAGKVAHLAVGKRLWPRDLPLAVYLDGQRQDDAVTVAQAGLQPLSYVLVDYLEPV